MLRGRCCCAISGRSRPSSLASPSLLRPLTPLFPLHPRNSLVSALFPLLTQKQGGTPLLRYDQSFHFGISSCAIFSLRSFFCCSAFLCALRVLRGESSFRRFPLLATSHSSLATKSNYSRTYAKTGGGGTSIQMCSPATLLFSSTMLTIQLSQIVGAPTFPFLRAAQTPPAAPARGSRIVTTRRRAVSYTQGAQCVRYR
jgi:hypothetical protein